MSKLQSFQPVINEASQVLVLGSMPGVQSLREQQYYANPRNHFWEIMYAIFSTPLDQDYDKRLQFIKKKGVALWDVIETCQREGSLDSNIEKITVNDFKNLFIQFPHLKGVAFNGAKAFEVFRKQVGLELSIEYKLLPSTSPANTMKFEEKLRQWEIVAKWLN